MFDCLKVTIQGRQKLPFTTGCNCSDVLHVCSFGTLKHTNVIREGPNGLRWSAAEQLRLKNKLSPMKICLFLHHFFVVIILLMIMCSCSHENFQARTIFDFEKDDELYFLHWKCGTVMARDTLHATSGKYSLRLEMYPNEEYPGFKAGILQSWDGAGKLLVDVYNPAASEMTLSYRIDDRKDNPSYADRANGRFVVVPGENTLSLDLTPISTSGSGRQLDLDQICSLLFFVHRPDETITLYLDNIRLVQ